MAERDEPVVRRDAYELSKGSLEKKVSEQAASSNRIKRPLKQLERTVNELQDEIIL